MAIPLVYFLEDPTDNEIKLWRNLINMRQGIQGDGGPLSGWGFSSGPHGAEGPPTCGQVLIFGCEGQITTDGCTVFIDYQNKRVGINTCNPLYTLDIHSNECGSNVLALRSGQLGIDIDAFPQFEANPVTRIRALREVTNPYGTIQIFTSDTAGSLVERLRVNDAVDVMVATKFSGDITPPQITSDQTDYNPTGLSTATVLRLSSDATRTINSLAGGTDGRFLIVVNVGSQSIILKNAAGVGTASMRFELSGDLTIQPKQLAIIEYDATTSRWRGTGGVAAHELLSAIHSDTNPSAVTKGALVYGNSTPLWDRLPMPAQRNLFLGKSEEGLPDWTLAPSHLHGVTRWLADGVKTSFDLPDVAEYIDAVYDDGALVDPALYSLSSDRTQVVFDVAPVLASVLITQYVIASI